MSGLLIRTPRILFSFGSNSQYRSYHLAQFKPTAYIRSWVVRYPVKKRQRFIPYRYRYHPPPAGGRGAAPQLVKDSVHIYESVHSHLQLVSSLSKVTSPTTATHSWMVIRFPDAANWRDVSRIGIWSTTGFYRALVIESRNVCAKRLLLCYKTSVESHIRLFFYCWTNGFIRTLVWLPHRPFCLTWTGLHDLSISFR